MPNISNVNGRAGVTKDDQDIDENRTLVMAKAPTIQARDINRMGNTLKPTTVQQYAA